MKFNELINAFLKEESDLSLTIKKNKIITFFNQQKQYMPQYSVEEMIEFINLLPRLNLPQDSQIDALLSDLISIRLNIFSAAEDFSELSLLRSQLRQFKKYNLYATILESHPMYILRYHELSKYLRYVDQTDSPAYTIANELYKELKKYKKQDAKSAYQKIEAYYYHVNKITLLTSDNSVGWFSTRWLTDDAINHYQAIVTLAKQGQVNAYRYALRFQHKNAHVIQGATLSDLVTTLSPVWLFCQLTNSKLKKCVQIDFPDSSYAENQTENYFFLKNLLRCITKFNNTTSQNDAHRLETTSEFKTILAILEHPDFDAEKHIKMYLINRLKESFIYFKRNLNEEEKERIKQLFSQTSVDASNTSAFNKNGLTLFSQDINPTSDDAPDRKAENKNNINNNIP